MISVAIILARKGSKRIPKKNIKPFLGKPIIAYSIETAIASGLFDEIMVSTDDQEIAEISQKYGAQVPFKRSEKNSNDFATTTDALLEVLNEYEARGKQFQYGCCFYATAPLVTVKNLAAARELLLAKNYNSVFPVLPFSYPIQRALQLANGRIEMVNPEFLNSRSQDLATHYHDSGQFYWFSTSAIKEQKRMFTDNSGAIVISEMEAQDIDVGTDWAMAELKYQLLNLSK
jgi:N-acylneuraminate cytidylyltransferase